MANLGPLRTTPEEYGGVIMDEQTYFESDEYFEICDIEGYINNTEEEVEFLIDILNSSGLSPPLNILDIGCGSGRHATIMAKKGVNATGIDISNRLIQKAKRLTSQNKNKPTFLVQDMREIRYLKKFDAITFFFSSFGVFDRKTNLGIIHKANQALKSHGILLLDVGNVFSLLAYISEVGKTSKRRVSTSLEVEETYELDQRTLILYWGETHIRNGISKTFTGMCQFYVLPTLEEDLATAGFKLQQFFGSFKKEPYIGHKSSRIIVVAQKT